MKSYKDFGKIYIGCSDIASLTLTGGSAAIPRTEKLSFGSDGSYSAYIVEGSDVEIGNHYNLMYTFNNRMEIRDDEELVRTFEADTIKVYRAAEMGCIIHLENNSELQ